VGARSELWIGVDVAKDVIDVAGVEGPVVRIARTVECVAEWAARVPRNARVVLEATGGYEQLVATALRARGIAVSIVNPRQVRDFAKATGQLAKTDRIDARVLAQFGAAVRPRVTVALSKDLQALRALLDRRRQLVGTRTAEKNRRQQTADPVIAGSIDEHIAWLDGQIVGIDRAIDEAIRTRPELRDAVKRLQTAPGVGRIVATTLVTHLPELGAVSRKHVAALAGLAPFARESGQYRGRRAIWGGRAEARAMLFLAAQSAARWNPTLRDFYARLLTHGKTKKAALAAVARKLLTAINAMARDRLTWQPAGVS
jgi:transposase